MLENWIKMNSLVVHLMSFVSCKMVERIFFRVGQVSYQSEPVLMNKHSKDRGEVDVITNYIWPCRNREIGIYP